jgi:hypothetical protein
LLTVPIRYEIQKYVTRIFGQLPEVGFLVTVEEYPQKSFTKGDTMWWLFIEILLDYDKEFSTDLSWLNEGE